MKIIDTRPIKNLDQTNEILNVPLYDIKLLDQVINIGKYIGAMSPDIEPP